MIPGLTLACTVITGVGCMALPVAAALLLRRRAGGRASSFFIGCGMWLAFVLSIEQTAHLLVQLLPVADTLWFTVLYSALSAALIEGLARVIAFRWAMKEARTRRDAALFGLGFGWMNAFLLLGADMLYTAALGFAYNRDPSLLAGTAQRPAVEQLAAQLQNAQPLELLAAGLDRLAAVGLQVCLACLVMTGVARGLRRWRAAAVGLQAAAVSLSVLLGAVIGGAWAGALVQTAAFAAGTWLVYAARGAWRAGGPAAAAAPGQPLRLREPLRRRGQ